MAILEFVLPEGSPDPCPMACGGLTEDAAGGPCKECWAKTDRHDVETCLCDSCDEVRAFDQPDEESVESAPYSSTSACAEGDGADGGGRALRLLPPADRSQVRPPADAQDSSSREGSSLNSRLTRCVAAVHIPTTGAACSVCGAPGMQHQDDHPGGGDRD